MSLIRINEVAKLISDVNLVVDIGSDHGLLSKLLIDDMHAKKVINIEKNWKPWQNSVNSTLNYKGKIENLLIKDGLIGLPDNIQIDICTIMGMGGSNIIEILNTNKNDSVKRFILQPNNNAEKIRLWIKNSNWKINFEKIIKENNIYYEILAIDKNFGYKPETKRDLFFGKYNFELRNNLFIEKWITHCRILEEKKISHFNINKKKEILWILKELKYEN
ncbi:MAG: tRNA (adenine(22)-N(1))-methyltransferase [Mycoplasmoidaceae bacterium]